MQKTSAGILIYKHNDGKLKLFIVHPGGPFWKDKDEGAWSIPKGEVEQGEENLLGVAKRELKEETGISIEGNFIDLGEVKQKSGKIVKAWAIEGDWSGLLMCQSFVEIEWPYKSGKKIKIPEVDKAGFFSVEDAKRKINPAQREFIERLQEKLNKSIQLT